jgi:hypothetical protein
VHLADPEIKIDDVGIARTEADRPLGERDRLVDRARIYSALRKVRVGERKVTIPGNRGLVFRGGLLPAPERPQDLRPRKMCQRVARR